MRKNGSTPVNSEVTQTVSPHIQVILHQQKKNTIRRTNLYHLKHSQSKTMQKKNIIKKNYKRRPKLSLSFYTKHKCGDKHA